MTIEDYLAEKDWEIVHREKIAERIGIYYPVEKLQSILSESTFRYLQQFKRGLYLHQQQAIGKFLEGLNVCLSTPTASGKSLAFYTCAIETLAKNPAAKILAIYPLKALGSEQEQRWEDAITKAGLQVSVGRIDGGVLPPLRLDILKQHQILIMTPDVIHAWLLSNLEQTAVMEFIKEIALIIIDEVHIYSGVFGSNSAFLFRRLNHLISKLNKIPAYIAASATMKDPGIHMKKLVGLDFQIIREESDAIPQKEIEIMLVNPPTTSKIITSFPEFMNFIAGETEHQFIAFVDSRKQTEVLASIGAQQLTEKKTEEDSDPDVPEFHSPEELKVLPYRSGYEEQDREQIQEKLSKGELKGVISTSALEMGIDIPHLTVGLLYGVPNSATSFYQRIGRIGRHQAGIIIIINNGSVFTKNLFRHPNELMQLPLAESTLYLENSRIQYIHALCLARENGEDDQVKAFLDSPSEHFETDIDFPAGFLALCQAEKTGDLDLEMKIMKSQGGSNPNHIFPMRDIDIQFRVEMRQKPYMRQLGTITYEQMLREAYPGAIYYYQTQCFRVKQINVSRRIISVYRDKRSSTQPNFLPTLIFPDLNENTIYHLIRYGELVIAECDLQIRESLSGYIEKKGRSETNVNYPTAEYKRHRFARNFFTTGILLNHPALKMSSYSRFIMAQILQDAFLLTIPYESKDISSGTDRFRSESGIFAVDEFFLSIYDQTYGSLRLTTRLLEPKIITQVFDQALEIAENDPAYKIESATINIFYEMRLALKNPPEQLHWDLPQMTNAENLKRIILPGSSGLNLRHGNEQFYIEDVFFTPRTNSLDYRGKYDIEEPSTNPNYSPPKIIVPIEFVIEIPGESKMGFYQLESGKIISD